MRFATMLGVALCALLSQPVAGQNGTLPNGDVVTPSGVIQSGWIYIEEITQSTTSFRVATAPYNNRYEWRRAQQYENDIVLAACWAHARRKLYDLHQATGSPIPAEALAADRRLYAIGRSIQGRSADARRHVPNTNARPLIEMMKPWLEMELGRVHPPVPSPRPSATRSSVGPPSSGSSMTAASNSTTIRSSAPPGRLGWMIHCATLRQVSVSIGSMSSPDVRHGRPFRARAVFSPGPSPSQRHGAGVARPARLVRQPARRSVSSAGSCGC
jgi:hypothetical protein